MTVGPGAWPQKKMTVGIMITTHICGFISNDVTFAKKADHKAFSVCNASIFDK